MKGKASYEVGKGKPPIHTRFKKGDVNNPRGKTSEQKKLEMENLSLAQQAKNRFLKALVAKQAEQSTDEVLEGMTGADILRLIKDAEDRVMGTPKQSVDLSSEDGTMTPKGVADDLVAALDAIAGKVTGGTGAG